VSLTKGAKITKPDDLAENVTATAHLTIPKVLLKEMLMDKARAAVLREQMQVGSDKQASTNDIHDSVASDTKTIEHDDVNAPSAAESSDADTHTSNIEQGDEAKKLAAKEKAQVSNDENSTANPMDIRQRAEEKVNNQLDKLVKEKVLIEAGDAYKIDVMYEKGQLKVNGENFLPDQLQL